MRGSGYLTLLPLLTLTTGLAWADDPKYAGSETCQPCHEDIAKAFEKNAHRAIENRSSWAGKSCESCHGPGAKHAESVAPEDIVNPGKLKPAENGTVCLACHRNQRTPGGRIESAHGKNRVSCTACHGVHGPAKTRVQMRTVQCSGCHTAAWAEFQKPFRHKVAEGAMSCTDCHNPHGSVLRASQRMRMGNEPGCLGCHGDKRGPFAFEHMPVRTEGCGACHVPHGSANPRMLARHEVRQQCLECHSAIGRPADAPGRTPPAFHDLRSPRFQNCTACHVKVHGSNVDRTLLR